jgi:hypothetical protein
MYRVFILMLVLLWNVQAADKIGILKIYEQFTLASAAAGKCTKPEKSELSHFLANYKMVYIRALMEIEKRKPDLTKKQALEIIKKASKKTTEVVYKVIEKEGCEGPKIQNLIKRFHVQAKWSP